MGKRDEPWDSRSLGAAQWLMARVRVGEHAGGGGGAAGLGQLAKGAGLEERTPSWGSSIARHRETEGWCPIKFEFHINDK